MKRPIIPAEARGAIGMVIEHMLGDYLPSTMDHHEHLDPEDQIQAEACWNQMIDGVLVLCQDYGMDPFHYDVDNIIDEHRAYEFGFQRPKRSK